VAAVVLLASGAPPERGDPCPESDRLPSPDLYCIHLFPTDRAPEATGTVRLDPAPTPFGVSVTADGTQRYRLTFMLDGLPAATYVAWATTPTFDTLIKLGPVTNGVTIAGEVALNKFMLLISAERSAAVSRREGRLVLRGSSPSMVMQPHGVNVLPPQDIAMPHHQGGDGWEMPPPYSAASPMVPGLERLRPGTTPLLPGRDSQVPQARPRETIAVAGGDTVVLTAGLVRRVIAGRTFIAYGFNGQYPGPLLEVPQRSTIVVRFINRLDQPSSIHWHGIRLDQRFDGVPGMSQAAVPPGDTFDYTIHFPDPGLYWYHPHVREDMQQNLGLFGNLLVRPPDPTYFGLANREETLILSDLLMGERGPIAFGTGAATHALMGRFGNLLLVNGEPEYRLSVARGDVVRFYLTNASNVRTWNLSIPGASLKLIAGDASRFEREEFVDHVVLAPAERYVVDARFERSGTTRLLNRVQALDHLTGVFIAEVDTLGTIRVTGTPARPDYAASFRVARRSGDVDPGLRDSLGSPPVHTLLLTLKMRDSLPYGIVQALRLDTVFLNPVEWSGTMPMVDWLTTSDQVEWVLRDLDSGRENMDINWHFRRGTLAHIRMVNDRHTIHGMQHPIHFHGQRFLVLAQNGVPSENLAWKDTVLVPAGATMDLLVDFSNPGAWMLHCHIAEHLESGMHAMVTVD
jgi:suppressor of ftsI